MNPPGKKPLSSLQILIMAISAGICVANVYYSQPILGAIGASFGANEKQAGLISVLSQAGYGLGLFFLTPIGDKMPRKRLVLWLQLLLTGALVLIVCSQNLVTLYAGSLAIGIFAAAAHVIMPMAASLVTENRGRVVSLIFTGIIAGVLTARVFSGFVTDGLGWRYVYAFSSVLVVISAILMQSAGFPLHSGTYFKGSYSALLRSTLSQFSRFALLRRSAFTGALVFGALSAFFITLTFHLSGPPFNYTAATIGLFGLLAVASALAAPLFGRLADKYHPRRTLLITIGMVVASIACVKVAPYSLITICVAVILLDVGVQATQVTNIALIYTLDAAANSRINTIYMSCYFAGGSLGAYAGLLCWHIGGWAGATWLMGAFSVSALLLVALSGKAAIRSRFMPRSRLV